MEAMMRIGRTGILVALVLAALGAGCAPGVEPEDTEPSIGPPARLERPAEVVLPLDAYVPTKQEYVTILRAVWKLTSSCVSRFGARYTASEELLAADVPPLDRLNERRYGLFSAEAAARSGYAATSGEVTQGEATKGEVTQGAVTPGEVTKGEVTRDERAAGRGDSVGWDPTANEKFLVVGQTAEFAGAREMPKDVNGKPLPADGCTGEAWRKLADGARPPADPRLAEQLRLRAYDRAENDSRVRSAVSAWSACMAKRGHTYTSVWEPNDAPWPDPPGASEIATATADVACKNETNLVGIWYTVEKAYQQRAVDRNAEALAVVKDYLRAQARNAATVLARGGR
jgi:hypothetical protein